MAETAVTVIVAVGGVVAFVAMVLCALVGTLVRAADTHPDARPLLAHRGPSSVPVSAAGVDVLPPVPQAAPAPPTRPADVVPRSRDHERAAA